MVALPWSRLGAAAVAASLFLGGCDEPVVCTLMRVPALSVEVTHGTTGEPAADGATVTVTGGDFVRELEQVSTLSFRVPYERAGTYRVTVEKEGFSTWSREGIVVDEDECHVHTVTIQAALEPTP